MSLILKREESQYVKKTCVVSEHFEQRKIPNAEKSGSRECPSQQVKMPKWECVNYLIRNSF